VKTRARKIAATALVSAAGIAVCAVLSIALGARRVSAADIVNGLFGGAEQTLSSAVVRERVVRTVFGLTAGAALGVSGALMQAITRNPIADPSVLGVNTGASLFVVVGIAFFGISSAGEYIGLALLGAALTAGFVYGIGSMGRGGATPIKLALAGAATSAALSSVLSAVMLPRGQVMDAFRFWQVGSVGGATWGTIRLVAPFLAVGALAGILSAPALNALALGDDVAVGLGVNTGLLRIVSAAAGVMLCGAVTALAGPIGFVGLMAPHLARLILGPDQRILIPASAAVGACTLTVSDVAGRMLGRPGELEVGVVTAFIGAPILIVIAMRSKVRSL
jgi:iron complex transport system permease protein